MEFDLYKAIEKNHHKALDKWILFGGHSDGESNSFYSRKPC